MLLDFTRHCEHGRLNKFYVNIVNCNKNNNNKKLHDILISEFLCQ